MRKTTLAGGTSPFAHLLNGMLGRKPTGNKADDDGIEPEDEGEVDQDEVDDALDDAGVDDVEDGGDDKDVDPESPEGKKAKKAKGRKAATSDDDEPEAEEPEDEKEAKAFKRGIEVGASRESKRCKAIFSSPAAGARPDVAAQLAFGTRQSAAEAIGVLTTVADVGTPSGARGRLANRMDGRRDPAPPTSGGNEKPSFGARAAAAMNKIGG